MWDGDSWGAFEWDWCGTGMRPYDVAPDQTIEVTITTFPDGQNRPQRIYSIFYEKEHPDRCSLVLLHESSQPSRSTDAANQDDGRDNGQE